MKQNRSTREIKKIGIHVLMLSILVFSLFPIYWMIITSMKLPGEIITITPTFWPKTIALESYVQLFKKYFFATPIANSLIISLSVSVISTTVGFLAAYALARINFKGRGMLMRGTLYAYLMPKAVLFIPLYMIITQIGLNNTLPGLSLTYMTFTIPYIIWMLISYLKSIPVSLEEAATIDGCSHFQSLVKIVLPLALPGVFSTFIISVTLCWNEYLYAMVMVHDKAAKTIPLVLSEMIVGDVFSWGPLMAGATIASIPILMIYLLSSRQMVGGLTSGGVKG